MTEPVPDTRPYFRDLEDIARAALNMWRRRFNPPRMPGSDMPFVMEPAAEYLVSQRTWRKYSLSVLMYIPEARQYLHGADGGAVLLAGHPVRIVENMPDNVVWLAVQP